MCVCVDWSALVIPPACMGQIHDSLIPITVEILRSSDFPASATGSDAQPRAKAPTASRTMFISESSNQTQPSLAEALTRVCMCYAMGSVYIQLLREK